MKLLQQIISIMADAGVGVVSVFCPESTEETASVAPFIDQGDKLDRQC